ncbi:guanylate-binding protein 3-like [Eleutherodactylus coqui]|uniref:guanylate-binding protein 3-like n=1 Tax=Eleutherodactylus coqui TaxID=57060 RepID=UPI003461CA6D
MSPRVEWMKMEGAEYWEDSTNRARGNEAVFRFNVKILMERFNQTGGFHSLQWMYGCELGDDGSIRVYDQDGYDGGEFMALDTQTWTYTATMNQAQITAQRWNSPDVQVGERNRNYLENTCIEWLKKYVEYGREDLERRAMMDSPVCLIENTKKGKLTVNEEAIKILTRIKQPVVVVSIVGLYRTGKSYLMNKLAGAKKGFNLGYNAQAETKGIWMWCVPHPTKPNNTLVLLDTEGLGDVEKGDNKNDNWIFCLAVLLSSALVYNSMAMIDQDTVDKLKFVGNISEEIKANSQDIEDEEAEFSKHFPIFTWAGRDFHLKLNVDGIEISEDVHLENALKLRERKKTSKDTQYNGLRQCLQMFFSKRKCFVFDQPSLNKEDRQNMENIPDSEMKSEFLRQTKRYYDYVFCKAEVKKVMGITAVTGILAVQEASQHYENMMKERVAFPTDTLDQFLQFLTQYEDEAHQILLQRSFKDNDQKFMKNYMADMVLQKYQASKGSIGINILKSNEALTKKDLEIEGEGTLTLIGL